MKYNFMSLVFFTSLNEVGATIEVWLYKFMFSDFSPAAYNHICLGIETKRSLIIIYLFIFTCAQARVHSFGYGIRLKKDLKIM